MKNSTYTIYVDGHRYCVSSRKFSGINKWEGPLYKEGQQVLMVYSRKDVARVLRVCIDNNIDVYSRRHVGVFDIEFRVMPKDVLIRECERYEA